MANVPLKSLIFPGLDPTYIVPQKTSDLTNDSGFITSRDVLTDYPDLTNKPQINGVTLVGNKSLSDIGAAAAADLDEKAGILRDTASGELAEFTPDATVDDLLGLTVAVEPLQAGAGDPSASNIRRISGWSNVKVCTADNVLNAARDEDLIGTTNGVTFHTFAGRHCHRIHIYGTRTAIVQRGSGINVTPDYTGQVRIVGAPIVSGCTWYLWNSTNGRNESGQVSDINKTYNLEAGKTYTIALTVNTDSPVDIWAEIFFLKVPAQYTEYTVPLGQTVYGGTLDLPAGKMTVDRGYIDSYNGETLPGAWISDRDVYAAGTTPTTGAQVVYELDTPTEVTLTGQDIPTIPGTVNYVWADAGEVEVEYAADLKTAIDAAGGEVDLSAYRTAAAQDVIDAGKADKVTEVTVSTAGAVSQALDAGKIYHFTGALTALTITLNAAASGDLAQYHFDFLSSTTAPTLTMPNTVTMPDSFTVEASKRYEVNVLNNFGAVLAW